MNKNKELEKSIKALIIKNMELYSEYVLTYTNEGTEEIEGITSLNYNITASYIAGDIVRLINLIESQKGFNKNDDLV